jgi:hypothetical protein
MADPRPSAGRKAWPAAEIRICLVSLLFVSRLPVCSPVGWGRVCVVPLWSSRGCLFVLWSPSRVVPVVGWLVAGFVLRARFVAVVCLCV